ncbi:MAG: isoprenylcysteine carboxylmethyltransferase family protein [Chloroflexi bacterium]|nr:isoprenylcysteine carboxylmethyltransferase family protein [Chloroflexota bacterium]MBU1750723.1 isoprenylcysteine carboxylmethyltransferase family protein [Chloroflexota bacterium]
MVLMRAALFLVLVLVPYGIEQYGYWRFVTRNREKEQHPPTRTIHGYGWAYVWDITHLVMLAVAGYRIIAPDQPWPTWEWIGCGVFWIGVGLRVWALRELGPFYAAGLIIKQDHQVIQTGPYRYLRHPLHLGTLIQIVGLAFLAPVWLAVPAVGIAFVLAVYHSRSEDQALLRHLGPAYRDYYARTWDMVDLIFWKRRAGRT